MPLDELIPFLLVFLAATLLILGAWAFVAMVILPRREHLRQRIQGTRPEEPTLTLDELQLSGKPLSIGQQFDRDFETMIARTGLDINSRFAVAVMLLCGVLAAAPIFVWRYPDEAWMALPAFLLGGSLPLLFFWWRGRKWKRVLQGQLPDSYFLLARSIRAGQSLDQAIHLVGEHGVRPLSREFAHMSRQLHLGLSLPQVLRNSAHRLGLLDFNVLASVLTLHRATGGNLPSILDRLAASTRDRNQFEGQYRAATVLGRYSAAFIVGMVVVILVYLFFFQRQWAGQFFDTSQGYLGLALFSTAMLLEAAGLLLLYWFMKHEY